MLIENEHKLVLRIICHLEEREAKKNFMEIFLM